jgi:hypothetical protein
MVMVTMTMPPPRLEPPMMAALLGLVLAVATRLPSMPTPLGRREGPGSV